jgi:hypothetical protein
VIKEACARGFHLVENGDQVPIREVFVCSVRQSETFREAIAHDLKLPSMTGRVEL